MLKTKTIANGVKNMLFFLRMFTTKKIKHGKFDDWMVLETCLKWFKFEIKSSSLTGDSGMNIVLLNQQVAWAFWKPR